MSLLIKQQVLFSQLLGKLLVYAAGEGILVAGGEWWRSSDQAKINAAKGVGIKNSLHTLRLAVDLLCFRLQDDEYVYLRQGTEPEYKKLGDYWKSLHPDCAWGGDFVGGNGPDYDHYSLAWEGVK